MTTDEILPLDLLDDVINPLLELRGVMIVMGTVDTGKTTLIRQLARGLLHSGVTTAIVDADVGQSTIGPPATVGMSLFRVSPRQFLVRRPDAMAFVGSNQPYGFVLDVIDGMRQMIEAARKTGAEVIIVDTTGLAPTAAGIRLKQEELLRLQPDHLLALEKGRELQPVVQMARVCGFCSIHRIQPSPRCHLKPTAIRRGHRQAKFAEYFAQARVHRLSLTQVAVRGSTLLTGRPLSSQARLRVAEMLKAPVLRAELTGNRLLVIAARKLSPDGLAVLEQRFPNYQVRVFNRFVIDGLLCGLEDKAGNLLDLAIIRRCDFSSGTIDLLTPYTDLGNIGILHTGNLKIQPDGTEIGALRPGDI